MIGSFSSKTSGTHLVMLG